MRNWNGANLAELIHAQLAPFGSLERTTVAGPEFFLNPDATHALAPVFHELVTNAAKYGSLTSPQGRISVSWQISATAAGDQLSIEWQESGGPVVPTPTRTGFGSQMIFEVIRFELRGTADLQFKPPGVACTLTIPLARVAIVPRTE